MSDATVEEIALVPIAAYTVQRGGSDVQLLEEVGLYPDRTAGGDRHHRGADRPPAAGRAEGARGGLSRPVSEQPQADRPRVAQLQRYAWLSAALPGLVPGSRACGERGMGWRVLPPAAVYRADKSLPKESYERSRPDGRELSRAVL